MDRLGPALAVCALVVGLVTSPRAGHAELGGTSDRSRVQFLAAGDDDEPLSHCFFLPYSRCEQTLDAAIGYGGGGAWGVPLQWEETRDYMQLYVDVEYLFRVADAPVLHVGPSLGFDAELFDETRRFHIYATARARMWGWGWVTLDAALGPVGSFDEAFRPTAIGGIGELAFTLHGHLGAYVQTQVLYGRDGLETRVTAGFRGSFTTWAIIFAGIV